MSVLSSLCGDWSVVSILSCLCCDWSVVSVLLSPCGDWSVASVLSVSGGRSVVYYYTFTIIFNNFKDCSLMSMSLGSFIDFFTELTIHFIKGTNCVHTCVYRCFFLSFFSISFNCFWIQMCFISLFLQVIFTCIMRQCDTQCTLFFFLHMCRAAGLASGDRFHCFLFCPLSKQSQDHQGLWNMAMSVSFHGASDVCVGEGGGGVFC